MENEAKKLDAHARARLAMRRPEEKLTAGQKFEVVGFLYLVIGGAISAICSLFGVEWVVNLWLMPIAGFMVIGLALGPIAAGFDIMKSGEETAGQALIYGWVVLIIILSLYK